MTCDGTAGPDSTGGSTPRDYPTPTGSATSSLAELPSDVLDLTSWYLTLPTGANGDPDTVLQPDLERYTSPYFQLDETTDGVVFTADVDGVTTQNSSIHAPSCVK